jgi:hypothetical protein
MSKIFNFPCYQVLDQATIAPEVPRAGIGGIYMIGPEYGIGGSQPFATQMTMLFSFIIRRYWTARQGVTHGILSIGSNGSADAAINLSVNSNLASPNRQALRLTAYNADSATYRYDIFLGDENGTDWLLTNKLYCVGISVSSTGMSYCVNGVTNPTRIINTNNPGALAINAGSDRVWVHGYNAQRTGRSFEESLQHGGQCPSLIFGAAAYDSSELDFNSQTVRDRIWDAEGYFKNPGEDMSLWFGDVYGANEPSLALLDGSPRVQSGSATNIGHINPSDGWGSTTVGFSAPNPGGAPAGMMKQYIGWLFCTESRRRTCGDDETVYR